MGASAHSRIGAACGISGAILLAVGTYLHPQKEDPNNAVAAFSEYAAASGWVMSHLLQLAGVILMACTLVNLAKLFSSEQSRAWASIGKAGAVAGVAIAAALQAVDGIALKKMVDAWSVSVGSDKQSLFYAAFAVRQVEIGLASMLSLVYGLVAVVYGFALLIEHVASKWLGWTALAAGTLMAASGLVMAYTGFSDLGMSLNMSASSLLLVWIIALAMWMWRGRNSDPEMSNS